MAEVAIRDLGVGDVDARLALTWRLLGHPPRT